MTVDLFDEQNVVNWGALLVYLIRVPTLCLVVLFMLEVLFGPLRDAPWIGYTGIAAVTAKELPWLFGWSFRNEKKP